MSFSKKGFTLLEVLLALAVTGTALVLLANAWFGSIARLENTQMSFEVASLLERKMGEFERAHRGKPVAEIKEEDKGDFGEDFPKYEWKMQSQLLSVPDLSLILASANPETPQEVLNAFKSFSETLGKAVKELKLTVIYKHPKRSLEFTVTNYFIDYDQELNLGMPPQ